MAFAATGSFAAAVSKAGGLGLIGGGYADLNWIEKQFYAAQPEAVGCGFITWAIDKKPEVLEQVLDMNPGAIFLSFGNPQAHSKKIKDKNIPLICQVQTLKDAGHALDCGADIIVAQGSEAGGHGEKRATISFVPEVADLIAAQFPNALLCAAGGIADGRGLAAALMLGADGVVIGSRLWASDEANVHKNMLSAAIKATGDETIRSKVMDIARNIEWPERYNARVLKNDFTDRWHENIDQLRENAEIESVSWKQAWEDGNISIANTFVGESVALINNIESVEAIIKNTVAQAESLLRQDWR